MVSALIVSCRSTPQLTKRGTTREDGSSHQAGGAADQSSLCEMSHLSTGVLPFWGWDFSTKMLSTDSLHTALDWLSLDEKPTKEPLHVLGGIRPHETTKR